MSDMTFRLEVFEGPLDLLLHLISKNKINIYDIPIASVLDQYLSYLDQMKKMDLDIASDFIAMASQLLYIKSRMLLPTNEQEEEEDPRAQLVESLLEYQRMKNMSGYFEERARIGYNTFVRPQETLEKDKAYEYAHTSDELIAALKNMMDRSGRKAPPSPTSFVGIVGHEIASVGKQITRILKLFFNRKNIRFWDIVQSLKTRSEVVASFLAVLELSKTKRITIDGVMDDFSITLAESTHPE